MVIIFQPLLELFYDNIVFSDVPLLNFWNTITGIIYETADKVPCRTCSRGNSASQSGSSQSDDSFMNIYEIPEFPSRKNKPKTTEKCPHFTDLILCRIQICSYNARSSILHFPLQHLIAYISSNYITYITTFATTSFSCNLGI